MLTDKGRVRLRGFLAITACIVVAVDIARTLLLVRYGLLLLAVAAALYLVACCIKSPAPPEPSTTPSEAPVATTEKSHDG